MRKIIFFLAVCFTCLTTFAQSQFSFHAVVRDGNGQLVSEKTVDLTWTLQHAGSVETGNATTTTNKQGLAHALIALPDGIAWDDATIQVDVTYDGKTIVGTPQPILPTPYTHYAETVNFANLPTVTAVVNEADTTIPTEGAVKRFGDGIFAELTQNYEAADAPMRDKLVTIEEYAQVNVQSDWAETDASADAYILNKPDFEAKFLALEAHLSTMRDSISDLYDSIAALREAMQPAPTPDHLPEITLTAHPTEPFIVGHGSVEVEYTATNVPGATYIWTIGGTTITSTSNTRTITYDNIGEQIVSVEVMLNGETGNASCTIIVDGRIFISASKTNVALCDNQTEKTIVFTATEIPGEVYTWTVNGVAEAETSNILTKSFTAAGDYQVSVSVAAHTATLPTTIAHITAMAPYLGLCEDETGAVTVKTHQNVTTDTEVKLYDSNNEWVKDIFPYAVGEQIIATNELPVGDYVAVATNDAGCVTEEPIHIEKLVTFCEVASNILATEEGELGLGGAKNRIDAVLDHEGNRYHVVQIGNQCWLRENMRATTSPKNPEISYLNLPASQSSDYQAYCYYYNNSVAMKEKYGVLYNWSAAIDSSTTNPSNAYIIFTDTHRGICPEGWHLPTFTEWNILEKAVDPSTDTTRDNAAHSSNVLALRLSGGCDWATASPITNRPADYSNPDRNSSHFNALPAGNRTSSGTFNQLSNYAFFWSVTHHGTQDRAYCRRLRNTLTGGWSTYSAPGVGYSVRCVRDEQ